MPDHTEDDKRYKRFQQSSTFIHKQLEQIADITMKMAERGIADSNNPHFNSIMRNHEKLLEEMKTIIEEYEQYLESKQ
jgi:phosphate uptake regulator